MNWWKSNWWASNWWASNWWRGDGGGVTPPAAPDEYICYARRCARR